MSLRVQLVDIGMSDQKKIKLSFSDKQVVTLDDEDCEPIILGPCCSRATDKFESVDEEESSDWRAKVHGVKERNLIALKNSILTDVTFEVGPENTPFKAHKLILSLGSPVFEAMFYGPLAEQGEKIAIPDIMPDGFKFLLRYLYGDATLLNNEVEALNAWIAADKYCVPSLKKDCDNFFRSCPMSSSNIWKLLENATFLNLVPLISRCKEYIEKHTESSLSDEGFLEVKVEALKQILDISSSNVSEMFLLKSVIHWGRHKVDTGEAVSLAEALRPLLPQIRFAALTPSEFCQFLEETNDLLDHSDALAILKHLTKPLLYTLPEWCCVISWQRGLYSSSSSSYPRALHVHDVLAESTRKAQKAALLYRQKSYKKHHSSSSHRFKP